MGKEKKNQGVDYVWIAIAQSSGNRFAMVYSNNPNITFNCIFALGVIRVNEKRQRLFLEIQFDIKEPVINRINYILVPIISAITIQTPSKDIKNLY